MQKDAKVFLQKAKTWNMVMLVTSLITAVMGVLNVVGLFTVNEDAYKVLGAESAKVMVDYLNSWPNRIFTVANFVILVFLIVCYIKANQKLGQFENVPKFPYYIAIGMMVVSFLISQLLAPSFDTGVEGMGAVTLIVSVATSLICMIPPALVIMNLFKADPEV